MGLPEASRPAGLSFPSVSAVVEADTIWAVWALSDTLYKFSRSGQRLAEVAMRDCGSICPDAVRRFRGRAL